MRFAASTCKPAPIYAQNNTRTPDDKSHAAIPMRSASTDSKTPYNYAQTSTPKAAWSHRYNAAKKKGKPTPAATAAQTRYLSSSPAATLHGKTQGFVLRLPPQNIAHATSCSHYNAVAASTCKPAPIYAQNNIRTPDDKSHAAIPMRSASTDSKTPYNYAHTSTPKAAWSNRYNAAKKRQTDPSRNRRTDEVPFIVACSHFTRKNTRFRAPASSLKHSPCNIHATSTIRFAASRSKPAPIYARGNSRWRQSSSHSNAICHHSFKKRIEPRTQEQALLQNT